MKAISGTIISGKLITVRSIFEVYKTETHNADGSIKVTLNLQLAKLETDVNYQIRDQLNIQGLYPISKVQVNLVNEYELVK